MQTGTKEMLADEYRKVYEAIPREALELDLTITFKTIQALAMGEPVSPGQLATIWQMPLEQVHAVLEQAGENGQVEINAQGKLTGAVLSLNPTEHQVMMDDRRLYAWCAYDAMYAPGVVGKPAQIVSKDPVTGETIKIALTADGVESVQPAGAVVSIIDAGGDLRAGPESARCTHMLFFGSRQSAEQWQRNRTGVSILTVEEVFEIVKEFQIDPARRLGLVE